ncbi:MAG: T9SS type A sorting domain-containing protein [Bacteroidales bacterium]
MKKLSVVLLTILTFNSFTYSQGCLPEGITFATQQQIDDFQTNYPGCTEIEGNVEIYSWTDINNLNGLNVLTIIGGDLWIFVNTELIDLTGLNNITSIGGDLTIADCESLNSLSGLENLSSLGGGLSIHNLISLNSLAELSNLTAVGGDLQIEYNLTLSNLVGLHNITQVNGGLKFAHNNSMINLTGLENLNTIEGELYFMWNDNLVSLAGIGNIEAASIDSLVIVFNPSLSECDVESICNYLASPNAITAIGFNNNGCNNAFEVQQHCLTGKTVIYSQAEYINIFPNPAKNAVTIICPEEMDILDFKIYDQTGNLVLHKESTTQSIDISTIQSGLYFVEIETERAIVRKKLIIN